MTEKKTKMDKGDFIELDKDQYKKKSNYKKYVYLFLLILFCLSVGAVFFKNSDFFLEYIKSNKQKNINDGSLTDQNKAQVKVIENYSLNKENVGNSMNQNQIQLKENFKEFKENINKNKNNLEQTQITLERVEQKLTTFIDQYKSNSDYYYSENYIMLNALLRIKNKFKNRENFDKELNILNKKFQSDFEIQNLLNSFQEIDATKIPTKTELLKFLNDKIKYLDQNLGNFIAEKIDQQKNSTIDIFSSKESFFNYLNDFMSSIVKISKIDENIQLTQKDKSLETNLRSSLVKTKEYLLYDDLRRSVETMSRSGFDEIEIKEWISDMESLIKARQNLDKLEFALLELTGKEFD